MSNPHQLGYQARTVSDTPPPLTPDDENLEAKDATINSEEKIMGPTQIPGENGNEEDDYGAVDIPWTVKWISLAAVMVMPMGMNWANSALGPLRNTLRNEMGINNEQFGVISSADAIVNSIWPLAGGIILDWVGVDIIAPVCTTTILIGSLVAATGTQIGNWRVLAGGYIIQGFGTALLDSCQQVFFHAFGRRQGLAFAFGLENAIASATSLASEAAAIPIRDNLGTNYVFWIPVAFCGFSAMLNFAYLYYAKRKMPARYRVSTGRERSRAGGNQKVFSLESLWLLPWCFWMLPATQLLQSGAAGGFSVARADIIRMMGYTEATAGFLQSGSTVIQVVLAPVFGYCIDRWCHRFHYVALAPLLWITSCSLLGFTTIHPMVALVFASLAGVINSAPLQMALHLLVADHRLIGTAFGVWRAFNNSGSVVMDVSFGRIQDRTPGRGYDRVLKLTIGLKAWAFALGIGYILVDKIYLGSGLTMTRKRRDAIEASIPKEDKPRHPLLKREPVAWVTYTCLTLLAGFVVTAWVLFFLGLAS